MQSSATLPPRLLHHKPDIVVKYLYSLLVLPWLFIGVSAQGPSLEINPNGVLLGDAFTMQVKGLVPQQPVLVRARRVAKQDEVYSSSLKLVADEKGCVDLSTPSKPQRAPAELLWSMTREVNSKAPSARTNDLEPLLTTISVEQHGMVVASATLKQLMIAKDIVREPVREKGMVGTLFRPLAASRYPAIIGFGGSGGGLSEGREALLASQGYVVLALAYFNYEKLPQSLVQIPLEYFGTAIEWLQAQPFVNQDKLAVMGTSRGGELALLLGATYPQVKAVIGYVPSHVVWPGAPLRPAWSYQGKSVPFMSQLPDARLTRELMKPDPASNTPAFLLQLANRANVQQAEIAVEKIRGPVLLFSGEDDKLWPSSYMAEQVMIRLRDHAHPFKSEHYSYPGCGHSFPLPVLPVPANRRQHRVTKQEIAYGGSVEATAYASWDSWQQLRRFLKTHLTP